MVIPSLTYFQLSLEFVRGVYWPPHFSALYGLDSGEDVSEINVHCIVWNVKISDLAFADDAVILAKTLDIRLRALEVLNEESEPLGLQVSWVKTKIQAFNDILDAAILSVPVCGEDVEVTERFTYLGSDIHVSVGCEPEVNRHLGQAWGVMDSLDHGVWRCRYLSGRTKV